MAKTQEKARGMTVTEAARALGYKETSVYKKMYSRTNPIRVRRIAGRVLIYREDNEKLFADREALKAVAA